MSEKVWVDVRERIPKIVEIKKSLTKSISNLHNGTN